MEYYGDAFVDINQMNPLKLVSLTISEYCYVDAIKFSRAISKFKLLKYLSINQKMTHFHDKKRKKIFYEKSNCEFLKSLKNLETLILLNTGLTQALISENLLPILV